ncbi:hypothetical protein ACWDR1_32210, partial [Streptosporangium sandarakinum]
PAHTAPKRKVIRAGLLGVLTLAVLTAPFRGPAPAPVATGLPAMTAMPTLYGTAGPVQPPVVATAPALPVPVTVTATITVIVMPDLAGRNGAEARTLLHGLGVRTVTLKATDGEPVIGAFRWTVAGQSHPAGDKTCALPGAPGAQNPGVTPWRRVRFPCSSRAAKARCLSAVCRLPSYGPGCSFARPQGGLVRNLVLITQRSAEMEVLW